MTQPGMFIATLLTYLEESARRDGHHQKLYVDTFFRRIAELEIDLLLESGRIFVEYWKEEDLWGKADGNMEKWWGCCSVG